MQNVVMNDEHYQSLIETIQVMANAKTFHICFVLGEGGWSKTYTTTATLDELGYVRDENSDRGYHIISGKTTYLELVKDLHEWRKCRFIVMDDLWGALENDGLINILKDATDTKADVRYVQNRTRQDANYDVPLVFDFYAKIIFISNHIKGLDNPHLQALMSRGRRFNMFFSLAEKHKILYKVAESRDIPQALVDYIVSITDEASIFSIRTLLRAYDYYLAMPDKWRDHVKQDIDVDPAKAVVLDLMRLNIPVKEQYEEFARRTSMSRATFFRIRRQLGRGL